MNNPNSTDREAETQKLLGIVGLAESIYEVIAMRVGKIISVPIP